MGVGFTNKATKLKCSIYDGLSLRTLRQHPTLMTVLIMAGNKEVLQNLHESGCDLRKA